MSRIEKLYLKVASAPANTRFSDLVQLAEATGFVLDRVSGSHYLFVHPDFPGEALNLQSERGRAKLYQVRQVLSTIDRLDLRWW
jgi:hypothetical protein